MPRPPGKHDRVLKWGVTAEFYPYPGGVGGEELVLWLHANVEGPLVGLEAKSLPDRRSWDRLVFESEKSFDAGSAEALCRELRSNRSIELVMKSSFFQAQYPPLMEYDRPVYPHCPRDASDHIVDLSGDSIRITISEDDMHRLHIEADFLALEWADFGYDLFKRRLEDCSVSHEMSLLADLI